MIARAAAIELAKRSFYDYCRLRAPGFYRPSRKYLAVLCEEMQRFWENKGELMVINLPPRHGKSRTAALFAQWVLGKQPTEKIMIGSYNETLSALFSKTVRDGIRELPGGEAPVFQEIFPGVRVRMGDGASLLWSLEGAHSSFLATSPSGTATGFGCSLMLIDDLIKNAREACDEEAMNRQWEWFGNTMLSRLEEGGKIVIVMTRWATGDLAGRVIERWNAQDAGEVTQLCMKAQDAHGRMLCPEILSKRSFEMKCRTMGPEIAAANFQQEPLDQKGRLYSNFKTYRKLPCASGGELLLTRLRNYTDTADAGEDFLCSINFGEFEGSAYILNLLYTDEAMELTEPKTAQLLLDGTRQTGMPMEAEIESNNGGRGFARAVQRLLLQMPGGHAVRVNHFHQSKNKRSRILSNATWVMDNVLFPEGWEVKWPEFYRALVGYLRVGHNAHDDAPDALTGVAERCANGEAFSFD